MKKLWHISVYALAVMGILHVVFTPFYYHRLNVDAIWFISCGFLLIFQAFINILAWQMQKKSGYLIAMISNFISLLLILALMWILWEIQDYIGVFLALAVFSGSSYFRKKAWTLQVQE